MAEFTAASGLYPEVLGETDPIAFLMARCGDPTAGLDAYAMPLVGAGAGHSVPEPQPEPQSEPQAQADEEAEGDEETTSDAEAHRQTYRTHRDKPRIRMTRVPSSYLASVPGATRVHYFAVSGKTPYRLIRSMRQQAQRVLRLELGSRVYGNEVAGAGIAYPKPIYGQSRHHGREVVMAVRRAHAALDRASPSSLLHGMVVEEEHRSHRLA